MVLIIFELDRITIPNQTLRRGYLQYKPDLCGTGSEDSVSADKHKWKIVRRNNIAALTAMRSQGGYRESMYTAERLDLQ